MSDELQQWLQRYVSEHGAVAGTVHLMRSGALELVASVNIPPKVVEVVQQIPYGKGMAGLAWQRDAVVNTCNLKTDETGDVRPGAKAVDANAAVAIPIHDGAGGVRGVVGVAYMGERSIDDAEVARLSQVAESLPAEP